MHNNNGHALSWFLYYLVKRVKTVLTMWLRKREKTKKKKIYESGEPILFVT